MTPEALAHLTKRCKVMRRLIARTAPARSCRSWVARHFESLVRAVAHQQLNGTAAETHSRAFPRALSRQAFSAAQLARWTTKRCARADFRGRRSPRIRDIAAKTLDGTVPTRAAIRAMSDEEIIERLVQVRGVGRWTVEMLLIFKLGRPDVLPVDDFGVRSGFRIAFHGRKCRKPKELLARRTLAAARHHRGMVSLARR